MAQAVLRVKGSLVVLQQQFVSFGPVGKGAQPRGELIQLFPMRHLQYLSTMYLALKTLYWARPTVCHSLY